MNTPTTPATIGQGFWSWSRQVTTSSWANCCPLLFRRVSRRWPEPLKALKGWGTFPGGVWQKGPGPKPTPNKQIYWQTSQGLNSWDPELLSGSNQMLGPHCRSLNSRIYWRIRVWLGWTGWHWRRGRWSPPTLFSWRSVPQSSRKRSQAAVKRWRWPCLFRTLCIASTATSLDSRANIARLLRSVWVVKKISMKVSVRDPSCALTAMVPMLHRLKIAQSGRRRRRFNVFTLRNAYPFQKPDSWFKPICQLWSLEVRPTLLPLPPEESPNLFSVKPH